MPSIWSIFNMGVTPQELARQLTQLEENLVADINQQLTDFTAQVNTNLDEASTEIQGAITDLQTQLKNALEASGVTELSPEVQAALQTVREKAQGLADIVPNPPTGEEQTPE